MENSEEKNLDVKDTMQDKAYKVIKKCKEIAEKDFTKFSALFVAVMTVGLWVIKGMWYAYQSGRFSVYGIASCYITSDDESFLLQIIQLWRRDAHLLVTRFYEPRNCSTLRGPHLDNLTFNFKGATRRSAPFRFTSPCLKCGPLAVVAKTSALPWLSL